MKRRSQQGFNFEYEEVEEDARSTAYGGLPLVAELLRNFRVSGAVAEHVDLGYEARHHDAAWCVESLVMLFAAGGECLDDLDLFVEDAALTRLLGRPMPSPETMRRFLYAFHDESLIDAARTEAAERKETAFVPAESERLKGLHRANETLVHEVAKRGKGRMATVDIDASIHPSRKREALEHYKGGRGYQPVVALWAEQDLILADEFRDGNMPAGKETIPIAQRAFATLPESITSRRLRADSALYNGKMLRWLDDESIEYTISADMSAQLKKACLAIDSEKWKALEERSLESVHVTEVDWSPADWPKRRAPLRFIGIRFSPKQGSLFETPKFLAIVTNRKQSAKELVRWHWEKAGTIEHVHRVLKRELGAAVLPCGRFGANAAWYRIATLAYNVLSAFRSVALPPKYQDARPKRLRLLLFVQVAEVINHARQLIARIRKRLKREFELPGIRIAILPA